MDTVNNEPKPEDQMADDRSVDPLDEAIRELGRLRRRETWADAPVAGSGNDAEEKPADLAEASADPESATAVPTASVAAPEQTHEDGAGVDVPQTADDEDDLFAPVEAADLDRAGALSDFDGDPEEAGASRDFDPAIEDALPPPRRLFGLEQALDAHRLGESMGDVPGEPELAPATQHTAGSEPEATTAEPMSGGPVAVESGFPESKQTNQGSGIGAAAAAGAAALAAGAAAATLPKAERRGWFGRRKKPDAETQTGRVEPTLTTPGAPSVVPPRPLAAAPLKARAAKSDPFAEMQAAIGPRPKGERRGWFGSKRTPAPDRVEPAPAEPGMVDLGPVREAMQAAALHRDAPLHEQAAPEPAAALYTQAPAAAPAEVGRVGVLLVNLGTPDAAKPKAVRRYLREFLSDRRVIEKDTFTWQLVFKGIILPLRPRSKARAYREIWNREKDESPLKTVTRSQAEKFGGAFAAAGNDGVVDWAMRYGNPSIASRIKALIGQGCERILLVPLYPQYSSATTATVCDEAFRVLSRLRNQPSLRVAPPYYAEPIYIEAIASSIEAELARLSFEPEVILASYHGMPLEYVQKGDPYYRHCTRTTELLRDRLRMSQSSFMMTFQSRFGRAEWLQPYTDQTLRKLARDGVKNVVVVTPGFAADCLETLEEIAVENAHIFRKKGGKNFAFIPCLNDSGRGMQVIREIAARELRGWV